MPTVTSRCFPGGFYISQTGGTIKVAAGKPYLRVVMYLYLSNFGAVIAMLVKSLTKIDKSMSTMCQVQWQNDGDSTLGSGCDHGLPGLYAFRSMIGSD